MIDTDTKPSTTRPRKMAREPNAKVAEQSAPKRKNKTDKMLALLERGEGATIEQLATATNWLPHTTRAALTGLKKKGHLVTSDKLDGQARVYRIATQ